MAKKKMPQREKAERARIKKKLQQEGILPPDKPRLNRKKFAAEVWDEWRQFKNDYKHNLTKEAASGGSQPLTENELRYLRNFAENEVIAAFANHKLAEQQ